MAIPTVTRSGLRSARLLAVGTATRIVLTPVVMWLVLYGEGAGAEAFAAILFCVAAATDWVDGRLARRWGVTSKIGSFLDTTADKLLVSGVLIALLEADRASAWIVAVIIGRELVLMGLRGVIASEGEVMAPSMLGSSRPASSASPSRWRSCGPASRSAGCSSTNGRCWPPPPSPWRPAPTTSCARSRPSRAEDRGA